MLFCALADGALSALQIFQNASSLEKPLLVICGLFVLFVLFFKNFYKQSLPAHHTRWVTVYKPALYLEKKISGASHLPVPFVISGKRWKMCPTFPGMGCLSRLKPNCQLIWAVIYKSRNCLCSLGCWFSKLCSNTNTNCPVSLLHLILISTHTPPPPSK